MSEQTNIAWCDSTVNFVSGCTRVSAGCQALKRLNKKPWVCDDCGHAHPDEPNRYHCDKCKGHCESSPSLLFPGESRKSDVTRLHRRRVFLNSMSDWLDPAWPIEYLAEMLDTMRVCRDITLITCTKRPELWGQRFYDVSGYADNAEKSGFLHGYISEWGYGKAPPNIIVLASVEDQKSYDQRRPHLMKIPAAVRGYSMEPLLGPIDMGIVRDKDCGEFQDAECPGTVGPCVMRKTPNWLIIGGMSGKLWNKFPMQIEWVESLANQATAAGTPLFVKQDSGPKPGMQGRIPAHLWARKEFPKL